MDKHATLFENLADGDKGAPTVTLKTPAKIASIDVEDQSRQLRDRIIDGAKRLDARREIWWTLKELKEEIGDVEAIDVIKEVNRMYQDGILDRTTHTEGHAGWPISYYVWSLA